MAANLNRVIQMQESFFMKAPNLLLRLKLNPKPSFKTTVRAFTNTTISDDYSNQSRGGLPRFFSDTLPPSKGGIIRVEGDEFWHMTKVLRLTVNDRIELFNGKGCLVEGSIEKVDRAGLDFVAVREPIVVQPRKPQWDVFAAFGTLKGGRADWLVEKCTELGANSVTPLLTERSPSISENRVDRLQRVIGAATKQCQRLHEMTLNHPMKVGCIVPIVAGSKLSFVAAAEATPIMNTLPTSAKEAKGLLIIGPEGDFTEEELRMITGAGAATVGLGPHRLRVETATIALLTTLVMWSDSLQPWSS